MSASRDSIYNVSSDIRLEDYTEDRSERKNPATLLKIVAAAGLVALLAYGVYRFFTFATAPEYKLAIANEYIDDKNVAALANIEEVNVKSIQPVYIRFQWDTGQLKTDYLRIQIYKIMPDDKKREEAVLGRRKPLTANYVYFMGPLEIGSYSLEVTDREGVVLKEKKFQVN